MYKLEVSGEDDFLKYLTLGSSMQPMQQDSP